MVNLITVTTLTDVLFKLLLV